MLPGAHRQVHKRAAGFAIYWYACRGGPQIGAFRGATLEEAEAAEIAGVADLCVAYGETKRPRPPIGLMARVIADYMSHPAYADLKPATKATYLVWLDRVREEFGHLSEREITPEAVGAWRRRVLDNHGARAADHALRIFSRVCSFGAHPERRMFTPGFKPHAGFESLYRAPPQHAWRQEWIDRIPQIEPVPVRHVLMLALNTGLRRADLIRLTWSAIEHDKGVIRLVTSKGERKGRRIVVRLTPALRATLAQIPKRSPIVLTNKHGRPWTKNSLAHAVNDALSAAGIPGRLHGLRRSAATHLAMQGLSSRQIARVMGWGENDAEIMSAVYVDEEA